MYGNVQSVLAAHQEAAATITPGGDDCSSTCTPGADADHPTIEHLIVETDTLPGLAIKYGTTETEIRKLNRMLPSEHIQTRVAIRVQAARKPQYR
jgi:hypothetical protein